MELFNALGLNLKILIAQFFNFAIFLFILWKFAYKPMLKFLDDRKDKIEKGITDAEKAEKRLVELEEEKKKVLEETLNKAKKEAKDIIETSTKAGEEKRNMIITKAKEEIKDIISNEKEKINLEKAQAIKEVKQEVTDLVILSLEKVLNKRIDPKKNEKIIKDIINK